MVAYFKILLSMCLSMDRVLNSISWVGVSYDLGIEAYMTAGRKRKKERKEGGKKRGETL